MKRRHFLRLPPSRWVLYLALVFLASCSEAPQQLYPGAEAGIEALLNAEAGSNVTSIRPPFRRNIGSLLEAASAERTGNDGKAIAAYRRLIELNDSTPFLATASLRLAEYVEGEDREEALDDAFEANSSGWFLRDGTWSYGNLRPIAIEQLLPLRSDRLSFRVFEWLGERSPFSRQYNYIFAICILALLHRLTMIPIHMKRVDSFAEARRQGKSGLELTRGEGAGAEVVIVLAFVVWLIIAMDTYEPQLVLDSARFLWVDDVTVSSLSLAFLWAFVQACVIGVLAAAAPIRETQQVPAAVFFIFGFFHAMILVAIGWYFGAPAYVFVFLILANGLTAILYPIYAPLRARMWR